MAVLWAESDVGRWQEALDGYWDLVKSLGKTCASGESLESSDRWFHEDLPRLLQDRQPAEISKEQLVKLVDWKLTRGKRRPRLLDFAKAADSKQVAAASRAAFAVLAKHSGKGKQPPAAAIKEALAELTVLKGVGPATASALLEAYDPSVAFTSDQAMLAALGSKDYTVPKVLELAEALRSKAEKLSSAGKRQWSAKEVEMALFAAAVGGDGGSAVGGSGAAGGGKKRKR